MVTGRLLITYDVPFSRHGHRRLEH